MSNEAVVGRQQCPRCLDNSLDNLLLYSDGGAHCFACGYHKSSGTSFVQTQQETTTAMADFDLAAVFKSRGVCEPTLTRYGVRAFVRDDGTHYVGFPLHDKTNALSTYHFRGVDGGQLNRTFWYTKGAKLSVPVFGWQLVTKSKATKVIVCEGETDTLALASALKHNKSVVVVGAVGTGFARKLGAWLVARLDKQEVVLAFDNDKAGREATSEVVQALKTSRPLQLIRRLEFEGADVGDALKAGEDLEQALEQAPIATVSSFLGANAIAQDVQEFVASVSSTRAIRLGFSPTLDAAIRIQPGKLIGIIGAGGCGKSTLAEHILLETLNSPGARAMMLSAEMKAYEVALKLVSTHDGFGYFDLDWLTTATDKEKQKLNATVLATCKRFSISDDFGGMNVGDLETAIHEQIAAGNAPDLVIVDHFLAIASELENTKLEDTAKAFKAIARNCNTCVVVICHTRKPMSSGGKRSIYRPTMADEYGSGGLGKYCDCVLGVAIDVQARTLLVETVKRERMGGKHADVRLKLTNWQLHEDDESEGLRGYDSHDDGDSYDD